ncbi:MAG TPA: DinB family protein [Bacteroidia bacterium]|nr:DinB family protein [Bacteroidia bacterium]
MLRQHIIRSLLFNLKYIQELLKGIPEEQLADSGGPGLENHPMFTTGHILSALSLTIKYLGRPYDFPEDWEKLFRRKGPGDPALPLNNIEQYPPINELMQLLGKKTNTLVELVSSLSDEELDREVSWRFKEHFPTQGDLIAFMCVEHSSMHLAQLSAWRRSKGFNSALEKL